MNNISFEYWVIGTLCQLTGGVYPRTYISRHGDDCYLYYSIDTYILIYLELHI